MGEFVEKIWHLRSKHPGKFSVWMSHPEGEGWRNEWSGAGSGADHELCAAQVTRRPLDFRGGENLRGHQQFARPCDSRTLLQTKSMQKTKVWKWSVENYSWQSQGIGLRTLSSQLLSCLPLHSLGNWAPGKGSELLKVLYTVIPHPSVSVEAGSGTPHSYQNPQRLKSLA